MTESRDIKKDLEDPFKLGYVDNPGADGPMVIWSLDSGRVSMWC